MLRLQSALKKMCRENSVTNIEGGESIFQYSLRVRICATEFRLRESRQNVGNYQARTGDYVGT